MPKGQLLLSKLRTEVRGASLSSKPKEYSNIVGTWNAPRFIKKNSLKRSSVLKEGHNLARMDSLITGTGLTSDLNTPDIKLENFDFKSKASSSFNVSNMEVAFGQPAVSVVQNSEDGMATSDVADSSDCYTLFDMSPGTRDLLQADQQEQRVNIQEYVQPDDNSNNTAVAFKEIPSNTPISGLNYEMPLQLLEEQPQICENVFGNGMGASALGEIEMAMPEPYNAPELSITDDDLNISLPKDILDMMNNLFPVENDTNGDCNDENIFASSTELDMYLGTHGTPGDLLTESLQESGLLDEELEAFNFEDDSEDLPTIDAGCITLSSNVIFTQEPRAVQPVNPMPMVTESSYLDVTQQSNFVTPTSSKNAGAFETLLVKTPVPQKSDTCPKAPTKRQYQLQDSITPSTTFHAKRQRRTAKKPLRFRDSDEIVDYADSASNEIVHYTDSASNEIVDYIDSASNEIDSEVKVNERLGFHSIGKTEVVVNCKEEDEDDIVNRVGGSRRGKTSTNRLTEEEKYHRIRILNNEASKRCRQKRKTNNKEMEAELEILQERNELLKKKHDDLKRFKVKFQSFVNDYFRKRLTSNQ